MHGNSSTQPNILLSLKSTHLYMHDVTYKQFISIFTFDSHKYIESLAVHTYKISQHAKHHPNSLKLLED